jgi:hypothetical protein
MVSGAASLEVYQACGRQRFGARPAEAASRCAAGSAVEVSNLARKAAMPVQAPPTRLIGLFALSMITVFIVLVIIALYVMTRPGI